MNKGDPITLPAVLAVYVRTFVATAPAEEPVHVVNEADTISPAPLVTTACTTPKPRTFCPTPVITTAPFKPTTVIGSTPPFNSELYMFLKLSSLELLFSHIWDKFNNKGVKSDNL